MSRARFDRQLLSVFIFITGLTILVGTFAIVSNRYLVTTHRALIQDNLPAAALTRQIQADSAFVATLASSLSEVRTTRDLDALSVQLLARVAALRLALSRLAELAPDLDYATPPIAELEADVRTETERARARIAARSEVALSLSSLTVDFSRLEEIVARQTDTARVQVTATIADLYSAPTERAADLLDQLADENFFTYDRLYELSRAIEAARVSVEQLDLAETSDDLDRLTRALDSHLATMQNRVAFLPSAAARAEVELLMSRLVSAKSPEGVWGRQAAVIDADIALSALLDRLQDQTAGIVATSDQLFRQMNRRAAASQAETERLSRWIGAALIGVLAVAVAGAVAAWNIVSRRTLSRLSGVSQHIVALGQGEYDREIRATGDDEIGRMEHALHILGMRAAEAKRLRDALEDEVTQRTRDVVTEMHAHDRAREVAEAANRAKTEFLAMMGHEIRTPLSGVVGMLRLIETDGGQGAVGRELDRRVEIARRAAENLLVLANDILDYAVTKEHAPRVEPVHFRSRDLLGHLAGYLRANAAEKGLAVNIETAPGMPPVLLGDQQKIRQILVNLLSNAVKYTETGQVDLIVDHAPDPQTGVPIMSFAVVDTGIGIAPGEQARIFDAYARGSGGEGIEGLGLGLSISRRLTDVIGGALTLESAPGVGSCFTLTVPLAVGDPEHISPQATMPVPLRTGQHVLVVEDQPVNRMVARGYLERMGATVYEAQTGAQSIEMAQAQPLDLVLMDLDLPDMGGNAAAAAIRDSVDPPPRIALLTAHAISDDGDMRDAMAVDRILHKPLSPRDLADLLGQIAPSEGRGDVPAEIVAALASDVADIGAEETAAIVSAFLREVSKTRAAIQAAQVSSDWPALARQAHRLRGAASNFALTDFCAYLGRVEAAALSDSDVPATTDHLDAASRTAEQTLRAAAHAAGLQLSEGPASM